MELGAFSLSLAVKDIVASRAFYEKLGFSAFGGNQEQNWLIMKSGTTPVGLFHGIFQKNMLTFNPGWDSDAKTLSSCNDVREIQKHLKENGVAIVQTVDATSAGPGCIMVEDPDNNEILIYQHV